MRLLHLSLVGLQLLSDISAQTPNPEPTPEPTANAACMSSYEQWKAKKYTGKLSVDPTFWRYQTQTQFVLTNGLALDLAVAKCKETLKILKGFRSGRNGPVDVQYAYKAMCTPVCLQCDIIHQDALTFTGCSCAELSTPSSDPAFNIANDWCLHNTGRLLCDILGFCGIWNCRVDDFMCPRYEWNKKRIPLKGPGSCLRNVVTASSAFSTAKPPTWLLFLIVAVTSLLLLL